MPSFNLANVFFVCLLAFIKSTYFASAADVHPIGLKTSRYFLKYTFDQGAKCLGVAYDGMEVMKFDPAKPQPESVLFTIRGNTAIVKFTKAMRIFRLDSDGFKPVFSGKQEVKSIDVLYKRSCDSYECFSGNKLYSYTAKEGILFNKVRAQPVGSAEQVIFETIDLLDMVYRVDYNERNAAALVLTTHHVSGLTRTFVKKNLGSWEKGEISGSCIELKAERVQFVIQSGMPKGVKLVEDDKYLKYGFENGVKCVGVNYDAKNPLYLDHEKPFPISMHFSVTGNRLFLNFEDSIEILKMDDGKFKSVFSGKKVPKELNISERKSNELFDYEVDDKVHTFKAKGDNAFGLIYRSKTYNHRYHKIWVSSHLGDVATKVVYDERGSNKVLTITHVSGLTTTFKKKHAEEWNEFLPTDESKNKTTADKVEFLMEVSPKCQGASPEEDDYDENDCRVEKNLEGTYLTHSSHSPIFAGV